MEYSLESQLMPGTIVGDTNRTVMKCTKVRDAVPGDTFTTWVAICYLADAYHPWAVWTVVARPEGWHAESGDYCFDVVEAEKYFVRRGGESLAWEVLELS